MDTWAAATGYDAGTPIQFVAAVSNEGAVEQSEKLLELGMRALPIRIPTAPGGQPGLRINLRANHSLVELTALTTWMDTYVVPPISRL